ncbi:MAG: hypothetical protein AB7V16_01225 [Vulcanibacillus sp.]
MKRYLLSFPLIVLTFAILISFMALVPVQAIEGSSLVVNTTVSILGKISGMS